MTTDPYLWPDADCLKNKLGIKDPELLAAFEDRIVSSRDVEMARDTLPGEYNLQHFQQFHWFLFRDVYDWAGQSRTVDITKDGLPFGSCQFLDEQVSAVLDRLAAYIYIVNNGSGGMSVIDAADDKVITTIRVGSGPEEVAIAPDGRHAYVTNYHSDDLSVIEISG